MLEEILRVQEDAVKVYVVLWIYANAVGYDRSFNPWKRGLCFSTNLQSFKVCAGLRGSQSFAAQMSELFHKVALDDAWVCLLS